MNRILLLLTAVAAVALGACSRTDNEPGPGGVTVAEAKALDDAAEMLESRDAVPPAEAEVAAKEGTGE